MKDTKSKKLIPVFHYISSAMFFLVAFLNFIGHGNVSTGVVFMSLGSCYLALGTISTMKAKEEEKEQESDIQ